MSLTCLLDDNQARVIWNVSNYSNWTICQTWRIWKIATNMPKMFTTLFVDDFILVYKGLYLFTMLDFVTKKCLKIAHIYIINSGHEVETLKLNGRPE